MTDYAYILEKAHEAAKSAVDAMGTPPDACGFAWVRMDGRNGLARYCRKNATRQNSRYYGSQHYNGWTFWCPGNAATQSMCVHEAGARAFAAYLTANGIKCEMESRMD